MIGFIVRLVGYALLLGHRVARRADALVERRASTRSRALHAVPRQGVTALLVAPLVLALIGSVRALRSLAVFVACVPRRRGGHGAVRLRAHRRP